MEPLLRTFGYHYVFDMKTRKIIKGERCHEAYGGLTPFTFVARQKFYSLGLATMVFELSSSPHAALIENGIQSRLFGACIHMNKFIYIMGGY
jgi:hypothetical protein